MAIACHFNLVLLRTLIHHSAELSPELDVLCWRTGPTLAFTWFDPCLWELSVETRNVKVDGRPSGVFHIVGDSATMGCPMAGIQEDSRWICVLSTNSATWCAFTVYIKWTQRIGSHSWDKSSINCFINRRNSGCGDCIRVPYQPDKRLSQGSVWTNVARYKAWYTGKQ